MQTDNIEHPLPVSNLTPSNENQDSFEMQGPMEVQIDNIESINAPTTMNPSNNLNQDILENQPIKSLSRIINVKPINMSDVNFESQESFEMQGQTEMQTDNIESINPPTTMNPSDNQFKPRHS